MTTPSTTIAGPGGRLSPRRPAGPARTIRVLVVDDSLVARRLVSRALEQTPGVEVVGTAHNGRLGLTRAAHLEPDVITMDVEMPVMDGITAVRELRAAGHLAPIIMCSTLTDAGAEATLEALAAGASDYVMKPHSSAGGLEAGMTRFASDLRAKIEALIDGVGQPAPDHPTTFRSDLAPRWQPSGAVRLVVAGSSTGGPNALTTVLTSLSGPLPVPLVVVQHMPPVFTRQLADRLDRIGPIVVTEAHHQQVAVPGRVYIAPGGQHVGVQFRGGNIVLHTDDRPPVNYSRPSVDVLFSSAVDALGGEVLGVVLTGMGTDGAAGSRRILAAGGGVVVQDKASSVVWGMPGAVVRAGHAHAVVPLEGVARSIERGVEGVLP